MGSSTRLEGKIALVTGASRGLGRHIAAALAAAGANVAVNYAYSTQDAEETVRLITAAGGSATAFRADITSEAEVNELIERVEQHFGGNIDILVNNATGPQPMLSIEESTWQTYLDQLEFFVKAPLLLAKAVLPGMKLKREGSIIHIGSEVVQIGNANFSSYVTAKSSMVGMTRSWASELGPHGIRVNLVAPGWIPVERHEGVSTEGYRTGVPLGRVGEPADIANAVVFLASSESGFVTGQCLSVNGGNTFGI
ncbi:SDR family oxidoreductase [Paenibacillus chondroitinus]|uniref:SDR family oxidoreductase n=1 Tax=Paenibacillus chondroitinus TaxID=59842 RepID=A0ABU6DFA6_9BACL|nr:MULTISPECIES: SDR family oxidoreductase [Paenibacillus]MCY9662955.1 SDR family oxidoreductase [Paenibacillus anseongense]MEB4795576.1 SDR family oxidoreductase [Paenibacillus chondroitinus]